MSLIFALISVESGGNDHAWGDNGKAWGCLQITQAVIDDVQRIAPRDRYYNCFKRADAIWICQTYLNHYATKPRIGREPTMQDYARIWNGGPLGWRKKETKPYWLKVKKVLTANSASCLDPNPTNAHLSALSPVGHTLSSVRPRTRARSYRPA
jgi:hypothetical protein